MAKSLGAGYTHWDHGRSMEIIHNAWAHGMNSLMRDASAFDFEENIRLTKEAVDFFHPLGIPIEAELGHVGAETDYEEALNHYMYTDPSQAAEFVEKRILILWQWPSGTSMGLIRHRRRLILRFWRRSAGTFPSAGAPRRIRHRR